MKTVNKRSSALAVIMAIMVMLFFTVNPAIAGFAESETEEEKAVSALEELVGTDDVVTDTYSTKDDIVVSDGKEALIKIPKDPTDGVSIGDGLEGELTLGLPEEIVGDAGAEVSGEGTVSYFEEDAPAGIAVQPIEDEGMEGVRATILINDASAPHSYDFELEVGEGSKVVTAAEHLGKEYDTGEVYVIDEEGNFSQVIGAAWAKDANGNPVSTHYELNGNTLTQVVDFDENTAFPVIADPAVWEVALCVVAIGVVVGSLLCAPAKIVRIKNYIKAAGGVVNAAKAAIYGLSKGKSLSAVASKFGTSAKAFCAEVLGIGVIISKCKF